MKILLIGDVVSRPGRRVLRDRLATVQAQHGIDFTVVNVENAAGGSGMTHKVLGEFRRLRVDVMTSGNHIWDKREVLDFIDDCPNLLRPHNYPPGTPGTGWYAVELVGGIRVGVLNLMGQTFMNPLLDSPFVCADRVIEGNAGDVDILLVDFHAETTSEKVAMGWYLDGRASVVVGTHTHIPTADERILPGGTAYLTDLGMTGCYDSVIGSDVDTVLQRMVGKMPIRLEPANGIGTLCGVVVDVDESTGHSRDISRIRVDAS